MRNALSYKNLINNLKNSWRGEVMSRHMKTKPPVTDKNANSQRDSVEGFREVYSKSANRNLLNASIEDLTKQRQKSMLIGFVGIAHKNGDGVFDQNKYSSANTSMNQLNVLSQFHKEQRLPTMPNAVQS